MKTQEFRIINANDKLKVDNLRTLETQIQDVTEKVNPKEYQGISVNNKHIIIEGEFDPDAIVTYKVPRKINYEFEKFPKDLQPEIEQLKIEYKLTKKQIKKIYKTLTQYNLKLIELEEQLNLLLSITTSVKKESDLEKELRDFDNKYSSFHQCLSSKLGTYNTEIKEEIKRKLTNLIKIIDDTIKNYL